jgi:hypothetical protein
MNNVYSFKLVSRSNIESALYTAPGRTSYLLRLDPTALLLYLGREVLDSRTSTTGVQAAAAAA